MSAGRLQDDAADARIVAQRLLDKGRVVGRNDDGILGDLRRNARRRAAGVPTEVVPILYSPWERREKSDELLIGFAALATAQESRCPVSTAGRIVYGEQFRLKRIDIAPLLSKVRNVLDAIKAFAESPTPPTPVLNEHCPACEYQSRCRGIAIAS